ncbi:thioesterase family protein [uncultured Arcticibacterium sp.]|uniref:acyl-CoA thioesterase n=1 Tax=uncultured Arcticibacterium sp. TaxID=2173042 RepID=UPI0030F788A3
MTNTEIEKAFFKTELPVKWGEMDAAQHVNNVNYLRWAESGRIGFYEKLGSINLDFKAVGIILAWQDCKYIFPITYPDTVTITFDVIELHKDRIIGECKIYSNRHNRIAAVSKSSVMAYDFKALKKAAIPKDWKDSIVKIYGDSILK